MTASYVFSHADSINLCSGGKFEFLIDEVAKPIYIDDYNFLRNAHEILIPHQSKDIMIQKKDGTWTDFDKAIDINIAAIKSKSGEKVLRFEFHYTLFGCIDVILNPKENGIYKGKGLNPINETMVVVYSWYPINFSQFWNYSNYKTITIYDSIDRNRLQDDHYFIGVTCVSLRISTLSSAELGFAFYNFSRNANDDYSNLNSGIFQVPRDVDKEIVTEGQPYDVTPYAYFRYNTKTTVDFTDGELKNIIAKADATANDTQIFVFFNPEDFVLENGSAVNKYYVVVDGYFVLKKKSISGDKSLKVDFYHIINNTRIGGTTYESADVILNDFEFRTKFPISSKRSFILFGSAVESTITYFDEDGDGFNFTEETGTLFVFNGGHSGVLSWKNLTELPPNTIKRRINTNFASIYEKGIELFTEGDIKTMRLDNSQYTYLYLLFSDRKQSSIYTFTDNIPIESEAVNHSLLKLRSSQIQCDAVIFVSGLPGSYFNPQNYRSEINSLRSDYPGYYITSKSHNISIIYSYYPFSTTVKHNVSEIKLRLQTNNGPERNVTVQEGETYSIESINRMIIYHPNAYVEFSQIKFDDPNVNFKGKYSQKSFSDGAWISIPIQTSSNPERTPEDQNSKSNSGKLGAGAIVGIVVGILVVAAIVAVVVIFVLKSRSNGTDASDIDIQFANIV